MADGRVKVGVIGSQFQADIQVTSFQLGDEAEVVAVVLRVARAAKNLCKPRAKTA